MDLNYYIRDIKDFPKKWIVFKDITPLLSDVDAFNHSIELLAKNISWADLIVWIDARWFIFAWALAYKLWLPFVPVRKSWKLPYETISINYDLEYWSNILEIHKDAIEKWQKVAIIDDLLATWGTAKASIELVEKLWWIIHSVNFIVNLTFLSWENKLNWYKINSLLNY